MANILDRLTLGEGELIKVDADPSAGAGTPSPIGAHAQWDSGTVGRQYIKVGAADTAWDLILTATSGAGIKQGNYLRLPIYDTSPNGYSVDDEVLQNSQAIHVFIQTQGSRTTPIDYRIPNPGDAVTAADFVLTEGAQTINGDKTFNNNVTIQGDLTVNGSVTAIETTNTLIKDKLITLNDGGAAASGGNVGFEIEEAGAQAGYFYSTTDRLGWSFKAPANAFELGLKQDNLTANRLMYVPDESGRALIQDNSAPGSANRIAYFATANRIAHNANFVWDITNSRLGVGTGAPNDVAEIAGNLRVSGSGSIIRLLAQSDRRTSQSAVNTTDATVTTLQSLAVPNDSMVHVRTTIIVRKTGGAGVGNVGDGAVYVREARYKNIGGTLTVNNLQSSYTSEDLAMIGMNATLDANGTNARVRVTGLANDNLTWECTTEFSIVD